MNLTLAQLLEKAQANADAAAELLKKTIWDQYDARLKKLPTSWFLNRSQPDDPAICVTTREGQATILSYTTSWELTYLSVIAGANSLLLPTACTRGPGHIVQPADKLTEDVPLPMEEVLALLDRFCEGWEKHTGAKADPPVTVLEPLTGGYQGEEP